VGSLVPRPESHDEGDRDSIERTVAERGEQSDPSMAVISCQTRGYGPLRLDLCEQWGLERGQDEEAGAPKRELTTANGF
jgi:hypothetical protein